MLRAFYNKYERHFTTIAFLVGFALDNLTLQRVDRWFEHIVLILYVGLSGFLVVVYNAFDVDRHRTGVIGRTLRRIIKWFPVAIQFSFGALFSGSLVFYSRSASLSVSWPFLVILILFIVGNELVKGRYGRLTLQLSGFFISTFLYFSFALPVLLHRMNAGIFIGSAILSFLATLILVRFVKWFSPDRFLKSRFLIYTSLLFLFGLFNVLYFANLIPPLPLSIKEIGIYHSIERTPSGDYILQYEPALWYQFRLISPDFHVDRNGLLYVYSAIFAPAKLSTDIVHEWFYKDETGGVWNSQGTISFPITGGRDEGYRGYTSKKVFPGKWRVDVMTSRGALIGRTTFTVEDSRDAVVLETILR